MKGGSCMVQEFDYEQFEEDVKWAVKELYGNMDDFAQAYGYSRRGLAKVLHREVRLRTDCFIAICSLLHLDCSHYFVCMKE